MGELTSRLFTEGDPKTVAKLENCATGRPSEVLSHFSRKDNRSGEHITKVQQALKNIQQLEPGLGIPEFTVNGVYDDAFAKAIFAYKEKRDIRNFANKIDDVVGIKTIRSLDNDAKRRPRVEPTPKPKKPNELPRALPNCVTDANCPVSEDFEVTLLLGASGGEILEVGKFFFAIRDLKNGLSAMYLMTAVGLGASGLPITPSDGGGPKGFSTKGAPVRVTRFGPAAAIAGGTAPTPPFLISGTFVTLQFRPDGSPGIRATAPMKIDTGVLNFGPSVNIQGARFQILTTCAGGPGAVRRTITRGDLVFS